MPRAPRAEQFDPESVCIVHLVQRCIRRAYLTGSDVVTGKNFEHRREWIRCRMERLASVFGLDVLTYAILSNHLHIVIRTRPDVIADWSDADVALRWLRVFPPRVSDRKPMKVSKELVAARVANAEWVALTHKRLSSLGWFMKCLKEPLARLAKKQDKCTDTFFEGRFKSIAILDEESLLSVCAYIDLNPVAAGVSETPEASEHTSIKARVEHVVANGRAKDLQAAELGSVAATRVSGGLEDELWLVPIEDRRGLGAAREGMRTGFALGQYVMLVEYTGRMLRNGKTAISSEVADVFARLGCTPETWGERSKKGQAQRLTCRLILVSFAN